MVLRLQAVAGCHDRGFPGHDRLIFFCFSIAIRVHTVSRQCFVFCHDNVAKKVPLSRPRWPRQEVRVATRSLVKANRFRVATGFHGVMSR